MNNIEEQLWNYIDGTSSPEEQKAISMLIEQDDAYRQKYNELIALNAELAKMELDEPPMAFTYNVMETIRNEHAKTPLKAKIDQRIIKGIGLFFVLMISGIMIYALANVQWSAGLSGGSSLHFAMPHIAQYLTSPLMQGFLFFDVVLALYTFDTYLRKKNLTKTYTSVQSEGQQK
ncbi:anti-sigma factor family protein [Mucilaginibacter sp.]